MSYQFQVSPPDPRPPDEVPPNEPVIPDGEDPSRPSIPEELPSPTPDPGTGGNPPMEMNGRTQAVSHGLDATRFGDWEANGKCVDF